MAKKKENKKIPKGKEENLTKESKSKKPMSFTSVQTLHFGVNRLL